jgi:hypothetical protein
VHDSSARDKGAEDLKVFGWRGNQTTRGLKAGQAVVRANRCVSIRTRPVSWLEPETSGVHPHTKGARCSAGGHRHRIPSTSSGLLTSRRLVGQGVRRPLVRRRKQLDQWNRDERDPEMNDLLVLRAAKGLQNAHTVAEGNARWGVPRGAGGCPAVGGSRRGRGKLGRQVALGDRRRGAGAAGLPAAASTGCVPLQSG